MENIEVWRNICSASKCVCKFAVLANNLAVLARDTVIALGIAVEEYQQEELGDCRSSASERQGILYLLIC